MPTKTTRSARLDPFENAIASSFQHTSTCWRAEWDSGGESIYALLAQYAALNALNTSHLCRRFVHRADDSISDSKSTATFRRFQLIDLRYSSGLKMSELCQALRLSEVELRKRFVCEFAPDQSALSSKHLVWCSRCAKEGRHFVTFQLSTVRSCPLHGDELFRRCPNCKQLIAYELRNSNKFALFVCPHCARDFAPNLRIPQGKVQSPAKRLGLIDRHLELMRMVSELPLMLSQVRAEIGRPHYPMHVSRPDLSRPAVGFSEFVKNFIESANMLAKTKHPLATPNRLPFSVVFSKETAPRLTSTAQKDSRREILEQAEKDTWTVYRSIRRQILSRFVGRHKICVSSAQYHLWWNLDGETMKSFCPVAIAFVRWRMQWEGRSIPSHLDRRERAVVPLGISIWLECRPPVNRQSWTPSFIVWLNHHLLAIDMMDTLAGWYEVALRDHAKKTFQWQKEVSTNFVLRNWACCGGRGVRGETSYFCYDRHTELTKAPPAFPQGHLEQMRHDLSGLKR